MFPETSVTINVTELAPILEQLNELFDIAILVVIQLSVLPLSMYAGSIVVTPDASK